MEVESSTSLVLENQRNPEFCLYLNGMSHYLIIQCQGQLECSLVVPYKHGRGTVLVTVRSIGHRDNMAVWEQKP